MMYLFMIIIVAFLIGLYWYNSKQTTIIHPVKPSNKIETHDKVVVENFDKTLSNEDFVKKTESKGVKTLTKHIKSVVDEQPEKVKRLTKKERSTVKKIIDSK